MDEQRLRKAGATFRSDPQACYLLDGEAYQFDWQTGEWKKVPDNKLNEDWLLENKFHIHPDLPQYYYRTLQNKFWLCLKRDLKDVDFFDIILARDGHNAMPILQTDDKQDVIKIIEALELI